MFEEKDNIGNDLLMRAILEQGQEEVPARVWDGVAAGLDRIHGRRRKVTLWWRSAVAAASVAAAVAVVFLTPSQQDMLVPEAADEDMIAVVENPVPQMQSPAEESVISASKTQNLTAYVPETRYVPTAANAHETVKPQTVMPEDVRPEAAKPETAKPVPAPEKEQKTVADVTVKQENDPFMEEETSVNTGRNTRTSIVLSGIAGTNSVRNNVLKNPMRLPSIGNTPVKTGITENNSNSTYGVPLSFGAGVKIDFPSRWSLGIGINYTLLTRTFYGSYTSVKDGKISDPLFSDIRNSQQYVGIPVNLFYNLVSNDNLNFYAYAGGTVERCLSDSYEVMNYSIIHNEPAKGLQLSANAGIGVEFLLGNHFGIYIDPSLRYYFDCGQSKSIRTAQPLMFGFEIGLRAIL